MAQIYPPRDFSKFFSKKDYRADLSLPENFVISILLKFFVTLIFFITLGLKRNGKMNHQINFISADEAVKVVKSGDREFDTIFETK